MFGFLKRKTPRPSMLKESVLNSIQYQITAKEEYIPITHEAQEYFYPDNRMNYVIPLDLMALLPLHWQRYAYRLDFEKLFPDVEESVLDIPELSLESKIKLKSIAFGELESKEDLQK